MTVKQKIQSVIEQSGAQIAVGLHHIESGEEVMLNADNYHPMASTLKIRFLLKHATKWLLVNLHLLIVGN